MSENTIELPEYAILGVTSNMTAAAVRKVLASEGRGRAAAAVAVARYVAEHAGTPQRDIASDLQVSQAAVSKRAALGRILLSASADKPVTESQAGDVTYVWDMYGQTVKGLPFDLDGKDSAQIRAAFANEAKMLHGDAEYRDAAKPTRPAPKRETDTDETDTKTVEKRKATPAERAGLVAQALGTLNGGRLNAEAIAAFVLVEAQVARIRAEINAKAAVPESRFLAGVTREDSAAA